MIRDLELNFDRRPSRSIRDLTERLTHRKEFKTTVTRTRNKIAQAIEMARDLIRTGKLRPEGDYKIVWGKDEDFLRKYVEKCIANREYVYDLETTGLDVFNDIIVGVCLFTPGELPLYIPINHTDIDNVRIEGQIDEDTVREILLPLLTNPECKYINANQKFDGSMTITNWGIEINNYYFDVVIAGKLLNENERNHKLKYLYAKYIKKNPDEWAGFDDLFEGIPFNYVPIDVAGVYGGNDGLITYKLYKFQSGYIRRDHPRDDFKRIADVMFDIEMPLIPILIRMELRGLEIDKQKASELEVEYKQRLVEVKKQMDEFVKKYEKVLLCDEELNRLTKGEGKINYNSPPQLSRLLYKVFKLPVVDKKQPTGTGKNHVQKWLDSGKVKPEFKEFLKMLQEFKTLGKLLTTYIIKIPNCVEPKTGAVHTQFNQYGAATGRFSSSHPIHKINLQNIPSRNKEIRKIFKARDGYVFVGSDFSQIEPRTLAALSGDDEMIQAYRDGRDLYATMGARVYNVGYWDCMEKFEDGTPNPEGKKRRDTMKSVLLGIMYCRGAKAIAEQFNQTIEWAEQLIKDFNEAYPKIALFSKKAVHFAETYGYVTTFFGRKRRLPDIKLKDKDDRRYQEAFRQVVNSIIQGTAADIMKLAMIRVGNDEEFRSLDAHLLLTVHDELICEAPERHAKRAGEILTGHMKAVGEEFLKIPMKCDMEITRVWYGAEVEFEELEGVEDIA